MIVLLCNNCRQELEIFDARNIGSDVTINVSPCECVKDKKCMNHCDEFDDLKEKHNKELEQRDTILDNIKKSLEGEK